MSISRAQFFDLFKNGPQDQEVANEVAQAKSFKPFAVNAEINHDMIMLVKVCSSISFPVTVDPARFARNKKLSCQMLQAFLHYELMCKLYQRHPLHHLELD